MKEKTIETRNRNKGLRSRGVLVVAALAVFALFAACERPEPETPTSPVVDTDTLPTNKFIGTWVLCAMNDVNSEPPATCDLADGTIDTLVFVNDTALIRLRGMNSREYRYDFSDHFLVCYPPGAMNSIAFSVRYYFRNDDQELVWRGFFMGVKNFCFHRVSQDYESFNTNKQ
jgi:hypothetical protein